MVRILIATIAICLVLTTALAVPVGFSREDDLQLRSQELHMHHYRAIDSTHDVSARDNDLEARNFWQKLKSGFSKVANFVAPIAKVATKFIREDPGELIARGWQDHELHFHHFSRDEESMNSREYDLEGRNFWQKLKSGFSKVADFVAPIAKVATKFIRDEDVVEARATELETRNFWSTAGKVAGVAAKFIREEDNVEHVTRDTPLQARDAELETRNFWSTAGKVAGIAAKFIREEDNAEHVARDPQEVELNFREEEIARADGERELELRWENDDIFGRDEDFEFVRGLELEELD